jgi:hypothetical protein
VARSGCRYHGDFFENHEYLREMDKKKKKDEVTQGLGGTFFEKPDIENQARNKMLIKGDILIHDDALITVTCFPLR